MGVLPIGIEVFGQGGFLNQRNWMRCLQTPDLFLHYPENGRGFKPCLCIFGTRSSFYAAVSAARTASVFKNQSNCLKIDAKALI
jgi:hypothetical protein